MRALALLLPCMAVAAPIYTAEGVDGSTVTLTDDRGPCEGSAAMAVWSSRDAQRSVRGCWAVHGEFVFIAFLDGDYARVPRQALRPATVL